MSTTDISLMMSYLGASTTSRHVLQDGTNEAPRATLLPPPPLPVSARPTTTSASNASSSSTTAWTLSELTGAILFAGAATAGGMLLGGPMEGLRGKTTCGGGGGGGAGGGGSNGSGGNIGGPVGESQNKHSFDSSSKEIEDQTKELDVSTTSTVPGPYEVRYHRFNCNLVLKCVGVCAHFLLQSRF